MAALSYYALEDFGVRHYQALSEKLGLTVTRLPSDTTFRRILQRLDFQLLGQQFHQWASSSFDPQPDEWVPIDGKSIKGTVTKPGTAYQNFVSLVSVYSTQQGVVLATQQFETKTTSELTVVQTLLKALHARWGGVYLGCAALSKKTTQLIIEGANDYVVTVKGNQPRLLAQLQTKAEQTQPCERFVDVEKTRGRITCRIVNVFTDLNGIDLNWVGLQSLIQVERIGIRQGKPYQQTNYYISSLVTSALKFAQGIRQHWGIENRLHWVKDVLFGEDDAPFKDYNAATNWSFIRTFAINVARMSGYDSLTKAERFLSHDIDKLFSLLE